MSSREIRKIAVIGAGNMGSGIAQKYATEGFPVYLVDRDEAAVERGRGIIAGLLQEGVERRIFRPEQVEQILGRIIPTLNWQDLKDADLVIEAVFEDLEVKRDVFRKLSEVTREDCLLATNTSSFFVKQLSEVTKHPERVVGLHYFFHPAKNRLVEVIPAPETTGENLGRAWRSQERIGKTPIASLDAPGFVVNRFFVPWINEATRLHEEALGDIPTIEQAAMEAFRIGMGPFQLMNVTGIPIGFHAAATLEKELGRFYAPSGILEGYKQSGQQFEFEGEADASRYTPIQERLLGLTYHVAAQLVSEGVGSKEDVDIGARVGLRWALGPFEMMNRQGMDEVKRIVDQFESFYGLTTPSLLCAQYSTGKPFRIRMVKSDVANGIATLTFNRPDAMNALNPVVMDQLDEAFDAAVADDSVRGIVLDGAGKAFVAGADIRFFVKHMRAGNYDAIHEFTARGQDILKKFADCPKPTVAKIDGLALGGGLELALACDYIVATDKAMLAFPETGIGIYPGLGGTQRTSRRIGTALAKWLIYTGQFVNASMAETIGLIDRVASHDDIAIEIEAAIEQGVESGREGTVRSEPVPAVQNDAKLSALVQFFDAHSVAQILSGEMETGGDEAAEKMVKKIRTKAPLALAVTEKLIDGGVDVSLADGLANELKELKGIFRTADAMEGLSTMGRKRPEFHGA